MAIDRRMFLSRTVINGVGVGVYEHQDGGRVLVVELTEPQATASFIEPMEAIVMKSRVSSMSELLAEVHIRAEDVEPAHNLGTQGRIVGRAPDRKFQPRNSPCVCGSGKKAKKCCVYFPTDPASPPATLP